MESWILFHAAPAFVVCFPKVAQLVLSHRAPTPLCAHPSLPILVTAEHVGQHLSSLQRGTDLCDRMFLWAKNKSQTGKGSSLSTAALRQQRPCPGERQCPSCKKTSSRSLHLSGVRGQTTPQSLISNEALVLQPYKNHSAARSEFNENRLSQVQCFVWACFSVHLSERALLPQKFSLPDKSVM